MRNLRCGRRVASASRRLAASLAMRGPHPTKFHPARSAPQAGPLTAGPPQSRRSTAIGPSELQGGIAPTRRLAAPLAVRDRDDRHAVLVVTRGLVLSQARILRRPGVRLSRSVVGLMK